MGRRGWWVMVSLGLLAVPAEASAPCSSKRVDPCGCHHVYGLRHCHPNRRSKHCELPAKGHPWAPLAAEGRSPGWKTL